jgi:TolB-like protein
MRFGKAWILCVFCFNVGIMHATNEPSPQVAVLDLRGDKSVTVEQLSFMTSRIVQEFVRSNRFTVLERGRMEFILNEQGFQQSATCTSSECQIEMGKMLGVEYLIGGSLVRFGPTYMINLDYIQVESGRVVASVDAQEQGELHEIVQSITRKIVHILIAELHKDENSDSLQIAPLEYSKSVSSGINSKPRAALSTKRKVALAIAAGAIGSSAGGFYLNAQANSQHKEYTESLQNWETQREEETARSLQQNYDDLQTLEQQRNIAYGGSAVLGLMALLLWFWPEGSK